MSLNLFKKYGQAFLEAKAREWGLLDQNATIFVQRMLCSNLDLSNQALGDVILGSRKPRSEDSLTEKDNRVADALNRNIMPKLEKAGCPKGNWKVTRNWLHETVFSEWVKPFAWQELWALTKPNPDIAVEIMEIKTASSHLPPDDYEPYQIPIGANVRYQIPMAANEYLILLEKDGNGDIFCLQPSRYQKYKVGEPVATSELIAIVSPEKPAVDWWEAAASAKGFLPMQHQQLEALMNWTNNARNDCRLWQFEVEIVMPKIEPVVTVTF